jgi:3-hydroxybutyryl-CoA dehydratase
MSSGNPPVFSELSVGMERECDYSLTSEIYDDFLKVFKDRSPVHVDAKHARDQGFNGVVMHGAILNGFLSNFIGMVFPGANTLELSVDIRYLKPCYLNDKLRLKGTINQKLDSKSVVVLHVEYHNVTQGELAANGRVQVKMTA